MSDDETDQIGEWVEPRIEHANTIKRLLVEAKAKGDPREVKLFRLEREDGSFQEVLTAIAANGKFLAAIRVA